MFHCSGEESLVLDHLHNVDLLAKLRATNLHDLIFLRL